MKMSRPTSKALCVMLTLLCVAVPLMAQQAEKPSDGGYVQGKADGERDGRGSPLWILAGLAGGAISCLVFGLAPMIVGIPCGVAGAAATVAAPYSLSPAPSPSGLVGKSAEYVRGYTDGFKSKSNSGNALYSGIGCGVAWVVVGCLEVLLVLSWMSS